MKPALLAFAFALQIAAAAPRPPALAQEGCPDTCPDGFIRSVETGACVPITPMV